MTQLHEVLAVKGTKETVANKLIKHSLHTLSKESLFSGQTRRLEMFNSEDKVTEGTVHQERQGLHEGDPAARDREPDGQPRWQWSQVGGR